MPIKNNDDVAHLLEATGRAGSSYREFENSSDQMSAPLIDAVFAKGPPHPEAEGQRPLIGAATKSDLLSEVFDSPRPGPAQHVPPKQVAPAEAIRSAGSAPPAEAEMTPRLPAPPMAAGTASGRTLSDIRRIISHPAEEAIKASPTDSLHGLFDRLAG
jgi:hypothetical protein